VRSGMLHGSETWPVSKENEVALQRAEMRMVRWMCNVKVKDRVPSKELRERLGIDFIHCVYEKMAPKHVLKSSKLGSFVQLQFITVYAITI